ncbi:hypothetical protein D3C84_776680 [compost metagenome]
MAGVPLDGGHQVGNEIGPALVLVLDLAPARLDLLIQGGDVVHAAPGQSQQQGESQQALGGPVPE